MARQFVPVDSPNYFDLEDPVALVRLDQPMTALQDLRGTVVIDEAQRRPDLFPTLRLLSDRRNTPGQFLILGSASPELLRQSSESLAGRLELITMSGFSLAEVGADALALLWLRGGFPRSFLAASDENSVIWRRNFVQTFLERDVPQFGMNLPSASLYRFWSMLAHYHGQVWNASEAARTLDVSESTARRYLNALTGLFMARQLPAWYENLDKRQVKSPKIYFRDTGILHYLLGIRNEVELLTHPRSGASWEGLVIEEILKAAQPDEAYFWATHGGAELDLLLFIGGSRIGVECKRIDAPRLTPSMRTAMTDLRLNRLIVIYPGGVAYPLADKIEVAPLSRLAEPNGIDSLIKRNPDRRLD